jgi:hypothetical protein
MRGLLLALVAGLLLAIAGPAAAGMPSSFGGQSAAQQAANMQSATSGATSTQYNPSNQNISVRVLSPGDNGDVSQSNNSSAESGALNLNGTGQAVRQDQSGPGSASGSGNSSSCCSAAQEAMQQAAQWAANHQSATSTADSTQKDPSNQNISVRVLSGGDNGSVDQSNNSHAGSFAGNANKTMQGTRQSQGSSDATPTGLTPSSSDSTGQASDGRIVKNPCGCGSSSEGIQAAGQDAWNQQSAESHANSTQIDPSNENISVRVLSPGSDGSVNQENNSDAQSFAGNLNLTKQHIDQSGPGSTGCGCGPVILSRGPCCLGGNSTGIQAAGQDAWNQQDATSSADSKQIHPQNVNKSLRLKDGFVPKQPPMGCGCGDGQTPPSYGTPSRTPATPVDGSSGDVTQQNNSQAMSKALNLNGLFQFLTQSQGPPGGDVIRI